MTTNQTGALMGNKTDHHLISDLTSGRTGSGKSAALSIYLTETDAASDPRQHSTHDRGNALRLAVAAVFFVAGFTVVSFALVVNVPLLGQVVYLASGLLATLVIGPVVYRILRGPRQQ